MSFEELASFELFTKEDLDNYNKFVKEHFNIIDKHNDIGLPYLISKEEKDKLFEMIFGNVGQN